MVNLTQKFLYRAFCILSLMVAIYLIIELKISGTLDVKVIVVFVLFVIVTVWGIIDWRKNYAVIRRQDAELRMYQLYIKPLEELVKEIRARQHEFDNHKNAILNMHLTIDNYEELVKTQADYIKAIGKDDQKQYMPLLRIRDKVLAGFLYSKIVSAPPFIKTDLEVRHLEIISKVSEHSLIEAVGTLVDNAYEACTKQDHHVILMIDAKQDHLVFKVKNQSPKRSIAEIGKFFEKGYSTKDDEGRRGLGLYRAKMLVEKHHGDITVSQEMLGDKNYIVFELVL